MFRASNSGISLSERDASLVKGMLYRGDRQHDIASWFGVNGGRIAEISTRKRFGHVLMETDSLPPPGPYLSGKDIYKAKNKLDLLIKKYQNKLGEVSNHTMLNVNKEMIRDLTDVAENF
tara:strand:+ start:142 stop:498 length:357 start_codon:yes stop_codon:yes gene_type:complete